MRLYEPIWTSLKNMPLHEASKTGVSLTANRALHRRIIKAVQKEKWMDTAYKAAIAPLETVLWYRRNQSILTFYLKVQEKSALLLDHRHF